MTNVIQNKIFVVFEAESHCVVQASFILTVATHFAIAKLSAKLKKKNRLLLYIPISLIYNNRMVNIFLCERGRDLIQ